MTFSITTLAKSLARHLKADFPEVTFYENPNQQGTKTPAMFLQQRFSFVKEQQSRRYLRTIGLDLTYLEDYNLPNLQQLYQSAAEKLDEIMDTFEYTSPEGETALIRAHKREWRIDLDAMHYKFELQVWVSLPDSPQTPLKEIIYNTPEVQEG